MNVELLNKISEGRVLVVGDSMLDRYWYGAVDRISPEAPVPVVGVNDTDERLGGAANVARNVAALGARCTLLSITGDDQAADALDKLLAAARVEGLLCRDKLLNTTVKLRVISQHQQLIRLDFESPASKDARVQLLERFLDRLPEYDVVILSDYAKGGLGHLTEMIHSARRHKIPILVDPKGADYSGYLQADLITPNRKEFEQVVGPYTDVEDLVVRARKLADELQLGGVLVTRGEEGMSLVPREGDPVHMPARAREVFDVTGAGDTVIATIASVYAVGGAHRDALQLANVAAGIVVGKLGAATATPEEIRQELQREEK